ncbi:MAG TPA: DUF11 domain-containing protein [Thermoanaerobaculia bacterium]|jgi:uncharacterized repeat protein (TIGR01451 family)|nr:DUF11 domain-containing protein [Thermoanaerobaculia bacterium]
MARVRRALFVLSLLVSLSAFAQSADQQVLSVTDSPDPIIPGNNITYTIQIRNNGPDPATNGGLNWAFGGNLNYVSAVGPAGFTCGALGAFGSCTNPAFPSGTTATFTLVAQVAPHLVAFPDGSITSTFSTSGVTPDPNNGNNNGSATTNYDSPQVDLQLTVSDSPDPVFPDGVVEYTVDVTNAGPDTATTVNFNAVPTSSYAFHSVSAPAGWSCVTPAVGALNAMFTCSRATWAPGSGQFVVRWSANDENIGINDTTLVANFSLNSMASNETNNANNQETETTQYTTPDADLAISVTDSPDPIGRDADFTYTVTVVNNGPAAAPNATMSVYNSSGLAFVSLSTPAGWSCTPPAVGAFVQFSCSNPSLANGATSTFTVTVNTDPTYFGTNDGTIQTAFSTGSSIADPVNANNTELESTAYVTDDADLAISVTDSPDPIGRNENLTYTVTVTNNGPTAAPNATMSVYNSSGLAFVSLTTPAGWSCTPPAAGAFLQFSCSNPSFAVGATSTFTVVANTDPTYFGIFDGTIQTAFTTGSSLADPVNANNSETESTAYVMPDSDMNITASDSPDPVSPDGNITYTVTVTNQGPDAATNARMTIAGNGGQTRFVSMTTPAGWSCSPPAAGTLLNVAGYDCTHPSFPTGASSVFTVVTEAGDDLHPNSDHNITQAFATGSDHADPDNTDNVVTVTTLYDVSNAELAVTNSDSPDPVSPGDTITYTQTITNNGPDTATNATMTQSVPSNTTFQSITQPAGWTCTTPAVGATGLITCTNASFADGASSSFTLVVEVIASPGNFVSDTVTGDSDASDVTPGNNSATAVTTVLIPLVADLGITKTTTADGAAQGSSVAYTITLTNNGPDAAANVVVTDTLPAELLFQSITVPAGFNCTTPAVGSTGTITCTAATFASGSTAVFTLVVQVSPTAVGPINNTATATSDTDDNNGGNNGGSASGVPVGSGGTADLSVVKSSQTTTAGPGDPVTYTITVTNDGPNAANDVIVTDTLPASLLFQSITPAAGFTCTTPAVGGTGTITCTGGPIANAGTATFTLVTTIAPGASGTIVNNASVGTSDTDPNGANSIDPSDPIVVATADLSITKTTSASQATTGSTITYTITVANSGPDAATNVVVNDDLPTGLQFVSATPSQGTCNASDPVSCNLGTIAAGANATITLQALVTATSGSIANTATVTSVTDDGNPGNNTSSTTPTPVVPPGGGDEGVAGIPTLSEWALLALAAMLGFIALRKMT